MADESIFTPVEKVALLAAFTKVKDISNSLERIANVLERAYPPLKEQKSLPQNQQELPKEKKSFDQFLRERNENE